LSELARIKARIKIRNAKARCLFDKLFEYNMSAPLIIVSRKRNILRGAYYYVKRKTKIYMYIYIYIYIYIFPFRFSIFSNSDGSCVTRSKRFRLDCQLEPDIPNRDQKYRKIDRHNYMNAFRWGNDVGQRRTTRKKSCQNYLTAASHVANNELSEFANSR